jgi:hypothetical protein
MKTAEEFLLENEEAARKKHFGATGDHRRLYTKSIVLELMNRFADYATDQPEETQDIEKLLIAFCWHLRHIGINRLSLYDQYDFERIAYAFLVEDCNTEE